MHLFSAPPTLDSLKSLHIFVLMRHNNRTKNYKPDVRNFGGNVSWRALFFTSVTDNYLPRSLTSCLINVTSQPHPYYLMRRCENSVDRAVISRKIFSSKIGTSEMLSGEKIHVHMQFSGLYGSGPDPVTSHLDPAKPRSCHSCQSAHLERHSLC